MIKLYYRYKLIIISWQGSVDSYRTFTAELGCDAEAIKELL
jgi:hypothetical protein